MAPKKAVKKGLTKTEEHAILLPRAKIAQLVEHSTENASVVGSIPSLGTFPFLGQNKIPREAGYKAYSWGVFHLTQPLLCSNPVATKIFGVLHSFGATALCTLPERFAALHQRLTAAIR